MSKNRKLLTRIFACFLALSLIAGIVLIPAHAAEFLPEGIYLTQAGKSTCTLCSATMMIRSRMYLSGNSDWSLITESGVRSVGWIEGTGLRWNFTYSINGSSVTVGHEYLSGVSISALKALLDTHTEGIVLYCGKLPHAVFLTDYEGDTFYCAETVAGYSGKRIPLASSYLAKKYGTQADVLSKVTAYWYVSSYSISENGGEAGSCSCSTSYAGNYICTTTDSNLRIRSGHGTNYSAIGNIPPGQIVYVSKSNGNWAHVEYNSISGYASMAYLKKQGSGHADGPTVSWWLSDTAYGEAAEEHIAGHRYYFCYRLYDSVTGESWDDVRNSNYSVKLTYYNPDGSVKYTNSGIFNRDEGWISDFFGEAGIYKIGIEIEGDYPYSNTRTFTVKADPILVHSSTQNVNLALNGGENETAYIWTSGYYSDRWSIIWEVSDPVVSCAWGQWTDDKRVPLNLTANSVGTTTVTVSIKDRGTGNILDRTIIHVAVHEKQYTVSFHANGGTDAPEKQLKYQDVPLTLSSEKPSRPGFQFLGWSRDRNATKTTYRPGDSLTVNADITLYALWKKGCESDRHEYKSAVTAPSYGIGGYTTHTCTLCGHSYTDSPTDPLPLLKAPSITKMENTANGIHISWKAVSGAESYRIFMKVDGGWKAIGTTSGTSFTWTGAASGKRYTFTMRCMTADGKVASGYDRTGWKHTYLAQPTISKTENTSTGIKLSWNTVPGAEYYQVFMKVPGGWEAIGGTRGTSLLYTGAKNGETYRFTIRCKNAEGTVVSSFSSTGWKHTYLAQPAISKTENTATGIKLSWKAVPGAKYYQVFIKVPGGWKSIGGTSSTSLLYTGAKSGETYRFTIRCKNAEGTVVSSFSSTGWKHTYLAQPAISKTENTATGIKLSWKAVPGAKYYQVFIKVPGGWKSIGGTSSTSLLYTGAKSGETYRFTIRCKNAKGDVVSSFSSTGWKQTYIGRPTIAKLENTAKGIKITWNAVPGAEKYQLVVKTANSGWQTIWNTVNNTYTWSGAKSGVTYTFGIRCVAADGKSYTSAFDSTGKTIKFVAQPTIAKLEQTANGIKITWNKIPGAEKYKLVVKEPGGSWKTIWNTVSNTYTWTGAKKGKTYIFSLHCTTADGKSYTSSFDSTGKTIKYT